MALLIHVPRRDKSVAIFGYDRLEDLISHHNPAIRQISLSHYILVRNFGYGELMSQGEYSKEQIEEHMQDYDTYMMNAEALDLEPTDEIYLEIEDKLNKILMSDDFLKKYETLNTVVTRELFRAFACGAVAHQERDVGVSNMPQEVHNIFGAQA